MKRAVLTALVVLAPVLVPRTLWAADDGNQLLKQCGSAISFMDDEAKKNTLANEFGIPFCLGFVQGITNTNLLYQHLNMKTLFCLPENGISNGQAVRIVVKHLRDHPEVLHHEAAMLAISAFREAFPCKEAKPEK
jgi:hypothetical protein